MSEHPKDWAEAHAKGDAAIREAADKVWAEEIKIEPKPESWRNQVFTAAELQKKTFDPVKFVVPQLIPEGLTLLCGRPKVGKSWAALEIAISVAMCEAFTCFGGRDTIKGDVLYAALEDNQRRLQRRMDKLLSPFSAKWPKQLTFSTAWKRLDQGGVADIADWIRGAKEPRLVILDTLAGVKPIRTTVGYAEDYESLTKLHRLANEVGIGVLVLHHTRKLDADDPLDTISGTLGLAGCADTALVFAGNSHGMSLYVRGRDIEEAEHAVTFNKTTCRWTIIGDAAEVQRSDTRTKILEVLKKAKVAMGPADIAGAAQLKEPVVKVRLGDMVADGEVVKVGRGLYQHPSAPAPKRQYRDDY